MPESLVSVIMPTYNHAEFIREAIESVLNQSYKNLELIIIDNYSEDNTQQIVGSFRDDRIRYYKFANHGIIAASRNYGLKEAKGKYVAFIDSDDLWFPDKLRKQVEVMEEDENYRMVFCPFKASHSNGHNLDKIFGPVDSKMNGYIYDKLIRYNFIIASSVVLRKTVLEDVGYFDEAAELRCAEDYDLWLRIARRNKVAFLPEILGVYRMHFLNANVADQRLQKALNVIDKQLLYGWTSENQASRAKANFCFREGWFVADEDVRLARSCFRQARRLNPGNFKIVALSLLGTGISFFPSFYNLIRRNDLDKRIGRLLFNHQSL